MSDFLRLLISLSISGGVLTLLTALLNRIFRKKMPRTFLYYLWLLVLLRFLLPVGTDWSLINRLVSPVETVQEEINDTLAENVPMGAFTDPAGDIPAVHNQVPVQPYITDETGPKADLEADSEAGHKETAAWVMSPGVILVAIWGLGALTCFLWKLCNYCYLKRKLWQNMQPVQCWEKNFLSSQTEGMKSHPILRRSAAAGSPMLVGVIRPVIWLSERPMNDADLGYALCHELTHWRRKDLWVKWAAALTACIHWFNPAAWYLIYALDRDCELSCDEQVIKGLNVRQRAEYGELVLSYAVKDSMTGALFTPFGNQKKIMKERLQTIMRKKMNMKQARIFLAVVAVIVVVTGVTLGAYAFRNEAGPELRPASSDGEPIQQNDGDASMNYADNSVDRDNNSGNNVEGSDSTNTGIDATEPGTLTPEVIAALAAKHDSLTIEDFAPYLDLTPLQENGSLWETIEFTYNGEPMCLRVSASDKDIVYAPYEGDLDGAVIFRKDFLELDTLEEEYAYTGSCADIRSGNLANILNGTVHMEDYITVELPEEIVQDGFWQQGVARSDFKFWMGTHGGVAFYRYGFTEEFTLDNLTLENAGIHAPEPLSGGIEIWGTGELMQGLETIRELSPLVMDEVILRRTVVQTEQGIRWYVAYTELEGSSISYCFYLREDQFTEEEFLELSGTIRLMENAIY